MYLNSNPGVIFMRRIPLAVAIAAGVLLFATTLLPAVKPGLTAEKVFEMPDGLKLHVWVSRAMTKEPAPLLVLLPMRGLDHRSYDSLRTTIMNRVVGFGKDKIAWPYVAAFDLRGHGRSRERGDSIVNSSKMPDEEFMKIPQDVATAVKAILADSAYNIDPGNILVVGASIGANSAIMLTELLPGVKKVAMLSPGENYQGLEPEAALAAFTGEVAIYASMRDRYSFSSAKILAAKNEKRCTLEEFYGSEHGTDIINMYPEAMNKLIDWLLK